MAFLFLSEAKNEKEEDQVKAQCLAQIWSSLCLIPQQTSRKDGLRL